MGTMTGATMTTEVRYNLGNRQSGGGGPTDAQILRYINWAYNHVARPTIYRHRELQATQTVTLADGTAGYTLTTVPMAIFDVRNSTDEYKLDPKAIRDIDDRPSTSGQPRWYAVWGNTIQTSPTCGSADDGDTLTIRYWQAPTAITTGATALRYEWDEVIVAGATWRGWIGLAEYERAMGAREHFGVLIQEVVDILKIEGEDTGNVWEVEVGSYQRGDG